MALIHGLGCCGAKELRGISLEGRKGGRFSPTVLIRKFGREAYNIGDPPTLNRDGTSWEVPEIEARFRYVIFTQATHKKDTDKEGYGEKFAAFITRMKFGTLIATEPGRNPNSGNQLKLWVWTPDHAAIKKFLKKGEE